MPKIKPGLSIYVDEVKVNTQVRGLEWYGPALRDVFMADWKKAGVLSTDMRSADYTLFTEYWVVDKQVVIAAKLNKGFQVVHSFQWRGHAYDMASYVKFWRGILAEMNYELQLQGFPVRLVASPAKR